jgi:hypothetical protein
MRSALSAYRATVMSSFWEFVAMKIEHVEERQKLAALYAQRDAVIDEEQAALAPIHARLAEAQDGAEREFVAAGGLTFEALYATRGKDAKDPKQIWLRKERDAKWLAIREALAGVRKTFEARRAVVDDELDAIEEAIGAKGMQDRLSDEGGLAFCALTGLLILDSDKVETVLRAAIDRRQSG